MQTAIIQKTTCPQKKVTMAHNKLDPENAKGALMFGLFPPFNRLAEKVVLRQAVMNPDGTVRLDGLDMTQAEINYLAAGVRVELGQRRRDRLQGIIDSPAKYIRELRESVASGAWIIADLAGPKETPIRGNPDDILTPEKDRKQRKPKMRGEIIIPKRLRDYGKEKS